MEQPAQVLPNELVRNSRVLPDRAAILRYLPRRITFAEIGVSMGDFTADVLRHCTLDRLFAIDRFDMHHYPDAGGGEVGQMLDGLTHRAWYERRFAEAIADGRLELREGDPTAGLDGLEDGTLDAAYYCASHDHATLEIVLPLLARKLKPGGMILLHDYTMFDQFSGTSYDVVRVAHDFMIREGWEMAFLALDTKMFCDIAIRKLVHRAPPVVLEVTREIPAPAPVGVPTVPGAPVVIARPEPEFAAPALEILSLVRPMDAVGRRLVRRGRPNDGGYVMVDHGLSNVVAYSLGISDDVSWDLQMAADGCQIFQYDHTVPGPPEPHPNFHFFRNGIAARSSDDGVFFSLDALFVRNGHVGRSDIVLKMDIEGYEWEVFAAIDPATLGGFSQILVELHGFTKITDPAWRALVTGGLRKLATQHQAVHVHANNWGWLGLMGGVMLPDTLELTYVRRSDHSFVPTDRCYPTPMDMPCNPDVADYFLGPLGSLPAPAQAA